MSAKTTKTETVAVDFDASAIVRAINSQNLAGTKASKLVADCFSVDLIATNAKLTAIAAEIGNGPSIKTATSSGAMKSARCWDTFRRYVLSECKAKKLQSKALRSESRCEISVSIDTERLAKEEVEEAAIAAGTASATESADGSATAGQTMTAADFAATIKAPKGTRMVDVILILTDRLSTVDRQELSDRLFAEAANKRASAKAKRAASAKAKRAATAK